MTRMMSLSLAAMVGSGVFAASPVVAQERGDDRYSSVAERDERVRDRDRSRSEFRRERIPIGTDIAVTLNEEVPVERDRLGDSFAAEVKRDVTVGDKVAIPAGAAAKVKLVESAEKEEAATLRLSQVEVNGKMRDVAVNDARADSEATGLSTGEKTAVGAAAGAVIGAVTGAGVLEGAVVGAGGGLAWGLLDDRPREIDDGTSLRFELEEELKTR